MVLIIVDTIREYYFFNKINENGCVFRFKMVDLTFFSHGSKSYKI